MAANHMPTMITPPASGFASVRAAAVADVAIDGQALTIGDVLSVGREKARVVLLVGETDVLHRGRVRPGRDQRLGRQSALRRRSGAGGQAIELRGARSAGAVARAVHALVRDRVITLDRDRVLDADIQSATELMRTSDFRALARLS